MSSATEMLQKADKKLQSASSSGFSNLFGASTSQKLEEAHDLYVAAANSFKLEKKWKESGDAFCKAADVAFQMKEKDDAGTDFWNASKSYKKVAPELAISSLSQTVRILTERGKFRQAADRQKEIGQIYQNEGGGDLRGAIAAYEQAAEWYSQEEAHATATTLLKDVAELSALLDPPDFPRAISAFEQVANQSLGSNLTRYSVREYWLKAGLCILAQGDSVSLQRCVERWASQDPSFPQTREFKFLISLNEAFEANDPVRFTNEVAEYDRLTRLDNWKTDILLRAKNSIQAGPSLN